MQITRNITDAWLAHWVTVTATEANNSSKNEVLHANTVPEEIFMGILGTNISNGFYIFIYGLLAFINILITLARAFLFAYAGLKAAKVIHDQLLNSVMHVSFIIIII